MVYHNDMEDVSFEKENKRIKAVMVIFAIIASFVIYQLADLMDVLPDFLDTHPAH